jgi:transcriptional regulator with XRE-family HTH domain
MLKRFIKENGLTAKEISSITGYNKNTLTNWMKLESDEKLPQDFILTLLREYPHIDISKYFTTHSEIIELSTKINSQR